MSEPHNQTLKTRLAAGERLVGTFVKTAHYQIVEILARTDLDFIVLDQEHAPIGTGDADAMLMAARQNGLPALVRIPGARPEYILSVLDMGAAGVLVPHVRDRKDAELSAAAARYSGSRGFSASHRAADYGRASQKTFREDADRETIVIAQIEDADALDSLDSILTADGLDGAFIGRADLMVSLGAESLDDHRVEQATAQIITAARSAGVPVGLFVPAAGGIEAFAGQGATFFVSGSDQSLLASGTDVMTGEARGQS